MPLLPHRAPVSVGACAEEVEAGEGVPKHKPKFRCAVLIRKIDV